MSKFKIGIGALVAGLMLAFGAFGLGASVPTADANIEGSVYILDDNDPADTAANAGLVARQPGSQQIALARETEAFTDAGTCTDAPNEVAVSSTSRVIRPASTSSTKYGVWICVVLNDEQGNDGTNSADVTFDSNDFGTFREAVCANQDLDGDYFEAVGDSCRSTEGLNTDELIVDCSEQPGTPPCSDSDNNGTVTGADIGAILVFFECPTVGGVTTITITTDDLDTPETDTDSFIVECRAQAGGITVTATPTTVEIVPAPSNTAHSLIQVTATDAAGNSILVVPSTDVDFTTDRCGIEESNVDSESELLAARASVAALSTAIPASYLNWDGFANSASPDTTASSDNSSFFDIDLAGLGGTSSSSINRSMAAAILHCDPHAGITNATPGVATVTVCVEVIDAADICRTVTVTVIGPPASITVAASPTSLRCGEKSQITVTVKDAIGQNVSDHTVVEMVTNLGGTIGGTGGVLSFVGPVVPISSSGAGTFGGVATAFLLTSESHSGPYEVVATTGGTLPASFSSIGIFSTPPIAAQVTVTCTIPAAAAPAPAATVTAPRTGTGITPPSTGDGGLADSSSSWTLFAIGGMAAFALAGLAGLKFARR